jgi:hypothetical protein
MGKLGKNTEQVVKEFINKRGYVYDYTKVVYTGTQKKVCIICKEHGEFWQTPNNHLNGQGCQKCKTNLTITRCTLSQEDVVKKCINVHGDKFDYSKFNYVSMKTKTIVICKKHGEFLTTPDNHIRRKSGCPRCMVSFGEQAISIMLNEHSLNFIPQYRFPDCRYKYTLPFDFYLPEYNTCIEYDGLQHTIPKFGIEAFEHTQLTDSIKTEYCKTKNIRLLRINHKQANVIENILMDEFNLYEHHIQSS